MSGRGFTGYVPAGGGNVAPGFHTAFTAGFYNPPVCRRPGCCHGNRHDDTDGPARASRDRSGARELPDRVGTGPGNRRQDEPAANRPP
ncbi:hypothetical protein GCM10018954_032150 [Kutzneria kofuensis]